MMHVVTACVYKDSSPAEALLRSCKKLSIPLHVYGIGGKFVGYCETKINMLLDYLRAISAERVMYLDCSDTVFALGMDDILKRYKRIQGRGKERTIIASDRMLHPPSQYEQVFVERNANNSAWAYPCAGVICGQRTSLIHDLEIVKRLWSEADPSGKYYDNDQGYWIEAMGSGDVDAIIDYDSSISVSLHGYKTWWFRSTRKRVRLYNGATPCILHFNGQKPKEKLMGEMSRMVLGE